MLAKNDYSAVLVGQGLITFYLTKNHDIIGDWPSGKAADSGSAIGARPASGGAQGNLPEKTCFQP